MTLQKASLNVQDAAMSTIQLASTIAVAGEAHFDSFTILRLSPSSRIGASSASKSIEHEMLIP